MSNLADSLAIKRAIEQVVDERIAKITDVCFRVYKALVISVNGDKMTVNILGDKLDDTITIPYSTAVSDAVRGDYVLVATTYNSWRNAVVWQKWNFKSPDGGGKIEVDTEMSDSSTNAVQNRVIKSYVDEVAGTKQDKLSETQLFAVNSGITQSKVAKYDKLNQVEGNPAEAGTVDLTKLQVGSTIYNVPSGGGNINLPDGTELANSRKILFGDNTWKTAMRVNGSYFNEMANKLIFAPTSVYFSNYRESKLICHEVIRRGESAPSYESVLDNAEDYITVTTSLKANTSYTVSLDLRCCTSVTFVILKNDGGLITTTMNASTLAKIGTDFDGSIGLFSDSARTYIKIKYVARTGGGYDTQITTGVLTTGNIGFGGLILYPQFF